MRPKVLALVLVLILVSVGFAVFRQPAPIKRPVLCRDHAVLRADGGIEFGGAVFSSLAEFKARLVSYKKENPECLASVVTDGSVRQETILAVANVMQKAGFPSVAFIEEPHRLH